MIKVALRGAKEKQIGIVGSYFDREGHDFISDDLFIDAH